VKINPLEVDVVGIATAIVMSLAAGMVVLWRGHSAHLNKQIFHTQEQLANCEKHHREAMKVIIQLNKRVGNLEGFAQRKHGDFLRTDSFGQ